MSITKSKNGFVRTPWIPSLDMTYGGVVDGATLRKRILWAFFIEEHKIVFGVLKAQQKRQTVEKG